MSQDLCIKESLQGINELRGGAFCKYIAQNNRTILLVTMIIPQMPWSHVTGLLSVYSTLFSFSGSIGKLWQQSTHYLS